MKNSLIIKIIISAVLCLVVGGLSGYATAGSIDGWYDTLNKPVFNPPNWIFGPVWTSLYILMGISAGIIWHQGIKKPVVKKALTIFAIHMVLNAAWSLLFFGAQNPLLAFIEIILLLGFIVYFTRLFYQLKPVAGLLQIPYILWVSFATVLNGSIVWLN